ncbi:hypothetical protein MFLAVUS_001951 [Mucor flavus]|uniref:Uncharacterized protein n=1 Tax=Mucor flavus TaxID=439312 RepID=A0ABP9YNW7_9FUNG
MVIGIEFLILKTRKPFISQPVDVYDLHRHTHFVAFHIRDNKIDCSIASTSTRQDIAIVVNHGIRLHWPVRRNVKLVKGTDALHYVFVVPSEWEEEIREVLIRPIFVRANLILKDDHKDRLLFCTDVESIYYYIARNQYIGDTKLSRSTIISVIEVVEESKVSIKLHSILTENPLFDFSNSLLFPKLVGSNLSSLTANNVKNGIREFIKIKFSFNAQEETIQNIMEEINPGYPRKIRDEDRLSNLYKPFITGESISKLDKKHEALIKSIRPIDICAEISKHLPNNLKLLLSNGLVKGYSLLRLTYACRHLNVDGGLIDWSECMLVYNLISFGSNYIIPKRWWNTYFNYSDVLEGAARYLFDVLRNSDVYSNPRILSTEPSATSSSVFLKSKPDAILNIDISLESTMLSYSILDENGLVKKVWNHGYFVPDTHLRSLGSFFTFSEETTLNIGRLPRFIMFVDEYFMNDPVLFNDEYDVLYKSMMTEIEDVLNVEGHDEDLLVSTQQQVYIRGFVLIYMIYINDIISRKLPTITASNSNIKIGFAITIDNMLLKRLFGTEDNLRDVIYASNLLQKDDSSKKLRIATHAEGLFPVIQRSFNLQFTIKSFFVVAQLYENHVQLTLNQVVTESGLENEYQEAIIIQEETIPIPNIYKSLCCNMWNNIIEDSSLIQLCDTHARYNDYELLDIFSLENRAEFTNNLKEHISKNILNKTLNEQTTDTATIHLSASCNCRVYLTQLFGKYRNMHYLFHLILFNYNPRFQYILMKLLKDETDHFLYEERIIIDHYTIPKLSNQPLQPVLQQEPFSYKAFEVGVLYHAYSENYGFGFKNMDDDTSYMFKNKISDSKITSIDKETVFPLFKKGNKINSTQIKRVFCLSSNTTLDYLKTQLFRLKKTDTLSFGKTVSAEDKLESISGLSCYGFSYGPDHYIPFIISIFYDGHSSSISLAVQNVGGDIGNTYRVVLAEPMTLTRLEESDRDE